MHYKLPSIGLSKAINQLLNKTSIAPKSSKDRAQRRTNIQHDHVLTWMWRRRNVFFRVKLAPVNFHLKWRHPVYAGSGWLGTEAGSYLSTRHFRGLLLPGTFVSCWHQVTRYLSLRQTLLVCLPHWPAASRARSYLLFTVLIFYST